MLSDVMTRGQLAGVMSDERRSRAKRLSASGQKISQDQGRSVARLPRKGAPADGGDDPFARRSRARRQDRRIVPRAAAQRAYSFACWASRRWPRSRSRRESVLAEDLLAKPSSGFARRHRRYPEPARQDAIRGGAEEPRRGAARGGQGPQGHAVHVRRPRQAAAGAHAVILDQVPIERLVLRFKGTEHELPGGHPLSLCRPFAAHGGGGAAGRRRPPTSAIADARRAIVDTVLKMIGQGRDRAAAEPDAVDEFSRS